jgi:hypothetical protein
LCQAIPLTVAQGAFLDSPAAAMWNTTNVRAHEHGGHFTPWENPDALIDDIRTTFRSQRRGARRPRSTRTTPARPPS